MRSTLCQNCISQMYIYIHSFFLLILLKGEKQILLLSYNFEDPNTVVDSTGNGNHGIMNNATVTKDSFIGLQAILFLGGNVKLPILSIATEYTIMFYFKAYS